MNKQTNESTDPALPDDESLTIVSNTPPERRSEVQLAAFRELARRIQSEQSVQRFEAALQTLLRHQNARPLPQP